MVTAEQNKLNLASARNVIATRLGLDPANMTYEQRREYNRALGEFVLKYPERFTDQTLSAARLAVSDASRLGAMDDTSFDWGSFGSSVVDNGIELGGDAAQIGKGIANTAAMASWLIPTVALAVVGIWVWGRWKRA